MTCAESGAQQTHALLVNEAGLSAQLREEVMSEVSELRGKLAAQRTSDGGLDNLGVALSARIDNLQKQLSRSVAALESRDAELAELKTQVQYLCRKASLKSTVPAPSSHRSPPPMGMTAGLSDVKAPIDSRVPTRNSTAGELNCLLQSYEAGVEGSNEQKRQLQQRISADIERARAELRKRAGVSR